MAARIFPQLDAPPLAPAPAVGHGPDRTAGRMNMDERLEWLLAQTGMDQWPSKRRKGGRSPRHEGDCPICRKPSGGYSITDGAFYWTCKLNADCRSQTNLRPGQEIPSSLERLMEAFGVNPDDMPGRAETARGEIVRNQNEQEDDFSLFEDDP